MNVLEEALDDLLRGDAQALDAFFHVVDAHVTVANTSATCHFHCINLDGNGRPRIDALIKHLLGHILDYTIPRKRLKEASQLHGSTGSAHRFGALFLEAFGLFTRLDKSGEGGELILFLLAERLLKLPQLICKMNLKTSTQMHYHGADGLHVGVDPVKKKLCLYWGESKLYSDLTQAVYQCMKSVAPLLNGTAGIGTPDERDLQLLGQFLNVEDPNLEEALKNYLDPEHPNFNSVEYRGLCLVGFDSKNYPTNANAKTIEDVKTALKEQLSKWEATVSNRLIQEKIDSFSIHVFLLPFPSVEEFRASLKRALTCQ